ncbi:hypothetical protein TNCV_3787671 [Trichonephila clavipes]|nr:hypothetical protein TNCV_3787671 [Trichonephila clavipes]
MAQLQNIKELYALFLTGKGERDPLKEKNIYGRNSGRAEIPSNLIRTISIKRKDGTFGRDLLTPAINSTPCSRSWISKGIIYPNSFENTNGLPFFERVPCSMERSGTKEREKGRET